MKNLFILVYIIYTKIKIVQLNEAEIEKPYQRGLTSWTYYQWKPSIDKKYVTYRRLLLFFRRFCMINLVQPLGREKV